MLRISVITVNYNNGSQLQRTIDSVINQNYSNLEYIVIDGNSSDSSVSILKKYDSQITKWVSEPDTGIYDAMNKGIHKATGDYLLFLNSGDILHNSTILTEVCEHITNEIDIFYGNLLFKSKKEEFVRKYPNKLTFSYFYNNRSLPHPGTFIKRDLFESVFYYNEKLKLVSDWEFFICAICKYNATYKHLDLVISDFDLQGLSNDSENKKLIEEERKLVIQNHFPFLLDDMKELTKSRILLDSKKVNMLLELEKSKLGRKINFFILKGLVKLFTHNNQKT